MKCSPSISPDVLYWFSLMMEGGTGVRVFIRSAEWYNKVRSRIMIPLMTLLLLI